MNWIGSPNFTAGRNGVSVDRIVIHWMDGTLASTDQVFQDTSRNTSAHYGIEDGNIHQYVKDEGTAYHAGDWGMNLRSIGIEHSAQPGRDASEETYNTSANLIASLSAKFNIPLDREHIIKHNEVVPTQCPGTVDIDKLITLAKGVNMDDKLVDENYARALFSDYYGEDNPTQDQLNLFVGQFWKTSLDTARHSDQYNKRKAYIKALETQLANSPTQQQLNDLQTKLDAANAQLNKPSVVAKAAQFNKTWVALGGLALTWIVMYFGADNQYVQLLIGAATLLGVHVTPNKSLATTSQQ